MANVSNVPYPGHEHSSPGFGGVLIHNNAVEGGADQAFLRGLENLLIAAGDSTLLRAFRGLETWDPQYDGAELWLYSVWHTSASDAQEHCTFRLFEEVTTRPWNIRSYHLYRTGASAAWTHNRPPA